MNDLIGFSIAVLVIGAVVWLAWWLLFESEGVYLGRRVVIWLYDVYAGRYDEIKRYHPPYEMAYVAQPIMEGIAPLKDPLVLDAAAGTGRVALALFRHAHFQGRVISIEPSRRMLEQAAAKLDQRLGAAAPDRAPLILSAAEHLPFADGTFDVVTCLEALEFMQHPAEVLAELVRVLRPGGLLVITQRISTRLMPGKTWTDEKMAETLFDLDCDEVMFEEWQVDYTRVMAYRNGESAPVHTRPLAEVLRCPACGRMGGFASAAPLACQHCGQVVPVHGRLIVPGRT